ncbi:MAG: flagellar protein FlaG [Bacillota bacterium]
MLQKIPGIEPAHMQNIKDQTEKQVVRGTRNIKVTDREDEKKEREWILPGEREELANLLEEVNLEMEKAGQPLRFALVLIDDKWLVEVWDSREKKTIRLISISEASKLFNKNIRKKGFLVDKKF